MSECIDKNEELEVRGPSVTSTKVERVELQVPVETRETNEKVTMLKLVVYGACENPNGAFVGLSLKQMRALGVVIGEKVELFAGGKSVGIFTVTFGADHIVKDFSVCTANVPKYLDKGPVILKKAFADRLKENGFLDRDIREELKYRADT